MYYVGFCSSCGVGVLGVRLCSGGDVVALCDECDAVWLTPDVYGEVHFPSQPDLPCPTCHQSLVNEPARWATMDDLNKSNRELWKSAILGSGEALGEDDNSFESFS